MAGQRTSATQDVIQNGRVQSWTVSCANNFQTAANRCNGREYLLSGCRAVYQAEMLKRPCMQDFLLVPALKAVSRNVEERTCMHYSRTEAEMSAAWLHLA